MTKKEFIEIYLSEDGLMKLEYDDERAPYGSATKKTCGNDNGILFVVEFYFLLDCLGLLEESDHERFYSTVSQLAVRRNNKICSGLFNRNPERNDRTESHDNYIAICAGSALFNCYLIPKMIVDYGKAHFYIYDNVNPGKLTNLTRLRTGSAIAFYKACGKLSWDILTTTWLHAEFLYDSYKMSLDNCSSLLLSWIELKALEKVGYKSFLFKIIKKKWMKKFLKITNGLGVEAAFSGYFNSHPITEFAKGIKF